MEKRTIDSEEWREYDFKGRVYRIFNPMQLFWRPGGTTHRVVDNKGIVHCCPAPGQFGCILRWQPKDHKNPVAF